MKIYFDVCVLGRLTDDHNQLRVRLEAEAVQRALDLVQAGTHIWIASRAVELEIRSNPDVRRRHVSLERLKQAAVMQELTPAVLGKARPLRQQGFGNVDALHLAAALEAACEVLLTTDDRFLRLAARTPGIPPGFVRNPIDC